MSPKVTKSGFYNLKPVRGNSSGSTQFTSGTITELLRKDLAKGNGINKNEVVIKYGTKIKPPFHVTQSLPHNNNNSSKLCKAVKTYTSSIKHPSKAQF